MRSAVLAAITGAVVIGASAIAEAHHSYAEFQDTPTTIEGTLTTAVFGNPHTILTVRAADGTVYKATWNAAFQLANMGVKSTELKAGDVVSVTGFPHRDPKMHELAKLRTVRRLGDGWMWKMESNRVTVTPVR